MSNELVKKTTRIHQVFSELWYKDKGYIMKDPFKSDSGWVCVGKQKIGKGATYKEAWVAWCCI